MKLKTKIRETRAGCFFSLALNMLLSFILFVVHWGSTPVNVIVQVPPRVRLLNVNEIKKPISTKIFSYLYGVPIGTGDWNSFFTFSVPVTDFFQCNIWMLYMFNNNNAVGYS